MPYVDARISYSDPELQSDLPRDIHSAARRNHLAEDDLPDVLTQCIRDHGIPDCGREVGCAE